MMKSSMESPSPRIKCFFFIGHLRMSGRNCPLFGLGCPRKGETEKSWGRGGPFKAMFLNHLFLSEDSNL